MDFLSKLSEKSLQFVPRVDPSKVDLENGIKFISKIQKLKTDDVTGSQHFYSATFCLHECFDIKFRYFGEFLDKNNEGQSVYDKSEEHSRWDGGKNECEVRVETKPPSNFFKKVFVNKFLIKPIILDPPWNFLKEQEPISQEVWKTHLGLGKVK